MGRGDAAGTLPCVPGTGHGLDAAFAGDLDAAGAKPGSGGGTTRFAAAAGSTRIALVARRNAFGSCGFIAFATARARATALSASRSASKLSSSSIATNSSVGGFFGVCVSFFDAVDRAFSFS